MKKENTYIMNIDGAYIVKETLDEESVLNGVLALSATNKFKTKGRDLRKLFSATAPFSLETLRIAKLCENKGIEDAFYVKNGKQYTNVMVNVTFDSDWFRFVAKQEINEDTGCVTEKNVRQKIMSKKKIRKYINKNGFKIDGKEYVFYKRGAAKAKNGYAFFIRKEIKDELILRSRLGIVIDKGEDVDLTSILAYESLISSGLVDTLQLDPLKEIFIMDDIYGSEFTSVASVTREINGELVTKNEEITLQNCLTDGQGLLDESVFVSINKKDKGFALLRSDMLKCCAFNTKLQEWFKYNKIEKLKDMFGREYIAKNIKLVITPNSLKFLKLSYKFNSKKECYEHWLNNIDSTFGIVKFDKEGNYGNYNRTTYQLLNSIPNLTKDELNEIAKEEKDFVMLLKNDDAVFRNYIGQDAIASLKLKKELQSDNEDNLTMLETTELYSALLLINSNVLYTKEFKKIRKDLIRNYVLNLKNGKIRIKDAKYCTLVSNPYEMLLGLIGKYNKKSIMSGREVYCKYYNNNQEFCSSRNPHINAGNVMWAKNIYHNEYKWFNLTDNIVVVNFYDNDMPDRLQGCDTDSDTMIMIPNEILISKAKYCEENFATPINKVKGSAKQRKYTYDEITKLDITLSNNYIGKIVNLSQIFNSYLNDMIMSGKSDKYTIDSVYQITSRLSSMSQIEIDKSKKVFDNISMSKELKKLRNMPYIKRVDCYDDVKDVKFSKMVVPKFFESIAPSEYKINEKFNTPMDNLQSVFNMRGGNRNSGEKHIDLISLLIKQKECDGYISKDSVEAIFKIISDGGNKIIGLRSNTCKLNEKAKFTISSNIKKDIINKLKQLTPSQATIHRVIKLSLSTNNKDVPPFSKYKSLTLNSLFNAYRKKFLGCFKITDVKEDCVLIKSDINHDISLFGEGFKKCKINENTVF